jgi:biopolymer transport protein ExbD
MMGLESIAMTDIVMNMFIFFFISFSLLYTFSPARIQKLTVNLPKASSTAPLQNQNRMEITMTGEGRMYLDGKAMTIPQIRDEVEAKHNANPELMVILRADKAVKFERFVSVLDILVAVGVKNLDIATEKA